MKNIRSFLPWLICVGAGLFTFLLHFCTACRGIDPVLSASPVFEHLGLSPFPPMTHPVWGFLVRILYALPGSSVLKAALFPALCLGAASGLLCALMQAWSWSTLPEKYRHNRYASLIRHGSGVLASVVFTLTLPVWVAGTRLLPISLDVAMMMFSLGLLARFYYAPSTFLALLIPLVWGIGVTEYGAFIVLAPVFIPLFVIQLWRSGRFNARHILSALMAGLLGCSIYIIEALAYVHSPAFVWRDFKGVHQVFWYLWRDQYLELKAGMVSVGWLLVFLMLVVPWLALLLMPLNQQRKSRFQLPTWFLFLVFSLMAGVVLLNLPPAPWLFSGTYPLLVLPYIFFAAWTARLAGTILYVLTAENPERSRTPRMKRLTALGLTIALPLFLGYVARQNYRIADARPAADIDRLAHRMAETLPESAYLIGSGFLDHSIALAAHEQNKKLALINIPYCVSKSYRRYVASLFDDPRLQNLAIIGWRPFMDEWSRTDPDFNSRVRIIQPADLWARLGRTALPSPLLYAGADAQNAPDAETLKGFAASCLAEETRWTRRVNPENLGAGWYASLKTLLSQINNNLGVALEDYNLPEEADALYQSALRLDDQNICALMNRLSLLRRDGKPEADALQQQLESMAAAQKQRISLWQLAARFGYIRDPGFYMTQGYAWAISGKSSAAIREVRRAIDLSGETPAMKSLLAHLYVNADDRETGEQMYQDLLKEDPANMQALAGLAHLALTRRDPDEARRYLDRLRELDVPESENVEEGILVALAAYSDNYSEARDMLRAMLKKNPANTRLWATLALLANENNDESTVREAQAVLENAVNENPMLSLALAQLNLREGNYEIARLNLTRALKLRPNEMLLHEQLLQLLVNLRLRDEAEEECQIMLSLDRNNALANYIVGTIQASRGENALAENSYRASIAVKRSPLALNDLAWLLAHKGQADTSETLALIEESIRLDAENPNTMDTYGFILMRQGRLDESEHQLRKAIGQQPDNPLLILHLAELYERQERIDEARQLAEPLLERIPELADTDYQSLRELLYRTRKGRKTDD